MLIIISIARFFQRPVFYKLSYLVIYFFACSHLKYNWCRMQIDAIKNILVAIAAVYIMITDVEVV